MSYHNIAQQVTEQDGWHQFLSDDLAPIRDAAQTLLAVRDRLADHEGRTLAEATEREERIRPFLVGGLTADGTYSDDALARFTTDFLGVQLDSSKQWVKAQREGLDADEYVAVTVSETEIVTLLQSIKEQITAIERGLGESPSSPNRASAVMLDDPQAVVDTMQEFLEQVVALSAHTHPFMFFAYTTQSLSGRYLGEAYPPVYEQLQDLTDLLGMQQMFVPDVGDGDKRDAYTVWGHEEDRVLDRLYRINSRVWETFGDDALRSTVSYFFTRIPDPREAFVQQADEQLAAMGWSYPEYIEERIDEARRGRNVVHVDTAPSELPAPNSGARSTDDPRYGVHLKALSVEKGLITGCSARTVNTKRYSDTEIAFDEPISLFRFFDDIMPAVFLGKYRIKPTENGVRVYNAR